MPSLIPGYEHDIFISYRQKDNKHDRWVTEFVDNLKGELEAIFKEDISIYFDENPHDGLLETHSVDKSLEGKLRCLIFIPIISQTYCDSKSFAWQHEFVAFNKMAKEDPFGRDIKLTSGNVSCRILPVKIYDLDPEDKTLLENELGGVLRCIEFIYKSSGVNRPLRENEEHPQDNLNKTYYRDQINKVANAVKEIIAAIKKHDQQKGEISKEVVRVKPEKPKNFKLKIIIASIIILALIVLGYFIIPMLSKPKEQLEKSIAVLPFFNDSPVDSNKYFINGIMEEVLNNLQKIKDFRVLSRNSVEQFRNNTTKLTPEIAKKLGVNYIVEGSGQKIGNIFRLRVQLLRAKGKETHLWAKSYEQEIKEAKDIFSIQNEIAQSIASELKATITPAEKQLINKTSTENLTAYDFYQRGREEQQKYWSDNNNILALQRAEELYKKALEYDSKFALACNGLANVYWNKYYFKSYYSKNFLDSVLILTNLALTYDNQLADAYFTRANYFVVTNNSEQAVKEYDKALSYNQNYWEAYIYKGWNIYIYSNNPDYIKGIENYQKAISLNHGKERPGLLRTLGYIYYGFAGFPEKCKHYCEEALQLDGDTISYYFNLGDCEGNFSTNYEKAIDLLSKAYLKDSTNINIIWDLAYTYMFTGNYKESLKYIIRYIHKLEGLGQFVEGSMHRIGYIYWQNGYKKEAEHWFNEQKKLSDGSIKLGRWYSAGAYYDLAGLYAFLGDKEKAYENLKKFDQMLIFPFWWVTLIKTDPLFNSIRNEPEFQQIVRDVESKYQAEHERVRKWLEENKML